MPLRRTLLSLLIVTLVVGLLVDDAEAQRRRRRRRHTQTTEQVEQPQAEAPEQAEQTEPEEPAPTLPAPPAAPLQTDVPPPDGEPAPEAEPSSVPTPEYDPGEAVDVSPIRADYVTLMDDLVQARMRVHALGGELFHTRIRVLLQDRTGDQVSLARAVVHLDGAPVYQSDGPIEHASDGREIFVGALAPGPHVLTLEVEQRAREDDAYRYTLRESYRFQVVRDRLSEVTVTLEDGSDMAHSFPAAGEGRYEVRTRMRVATRALPAQ